MFELKVGLGAVLAGAIASGSGVGIGSILTPFLSLQLGATRRGLPGNLLA